MLYLLSPYFLNPKQIVMFTLRITFVKISLYRQKNNDYLFFSCAAWEI